MPAVKVLLEVQQLNCWEAITTTGEENGTALEVKDVTLKNHYLTRKNTKFLIPTQLMNKDYPSACSVFNTIT